MYADSGSHCIATENRHLMTRTEPNAIVRADDWVGFIESSGGSIMHNRYDGEWIKGGEDYEYRKRRGGGPVHSQKLE